MQHPLGRMLDEQDGPGRIATVMRGSYGSVSAWISFAKERGYQELSPMPSLVGAPISDPDPQLRGQTPNLGESIGLAVANGEEDTSFMQTNPAPHSSERIPLTIQALLRGQRQADEPMNPSPALGARSTDMKPRGEIVVQHSMGDGTRRSQVKKLMDDHGVLDMLIDHFEKYANEVGGDEKPLVKAIAELESNMPEAIRASSPDRKDTFQTLLQRSRSFKSPSTPPPDPPALIRGRSSSRRIIAIDVNNTSRAVELTDKYLPGDTPNLQLSSPDKPLDSSNVEAPAYPYARDFCAWPVPMWDVVHDGMPPDQRAAESDHQQIVITVKSLHHLPKSDVGLGKCDPYVEVKFFDMTWRTSTKNITYDAKYDEHFLVFIHAENVKLAAVEKDPDVAAAAGLMIEFTCFDHDTFVEDDLVGHTHILLQNLLDAPDGTEFSRNLFCEGDPVYGQDGMATTLVVSVRKHKLRGKRVQFVTPTLQSILKQSDQVREIEGDIGAGSKVPALKFREAYAKGSALGNDEEDDKTINLDHDTYWREKLDKSLESLPCNICILILVVIDVMNMLITVLGSGKDSTAQEIITWTVLAFFFLELSLRMVAQGTRFLSNKWNSFDVVVIYSSIGIAAATFALEAKTFKEAQTGASTLRVFSRIAMAMRVLRVMTHVRKVNKLQGTVEARLRAAVSQNKRRYKQFGFDLDLTYITDRIIAMSAPAMGGHKTYRNDIHVVSRFLSLRHYASFFVFNLCDTFVSSDGAIGNYHAQMFFNQVQRIPFEDHGPPLLQEMIHFCNEASKWMLSDKTNVIAVHCKGGKGRTGVMIAAFMLWCGHRRTENYDPEQGIEDDTEEMEETESINRHWLHRVLAPSKPPNRGVDGPSQQRYVFYIEAMLYCGLRPLEQPPLFLKCIRVPTGSAQAKDDAWWVSVTVRCHRTIVLDSFQGMASRFSGPALELPADVLLDGDTKIEFFRHNKERDCKRKLMWFVTFHPAFYTGNTEIVFFKKKIDMLHKDTKCQKADENFKLTLQVATVDGPSIQSDFNGHEATAAMEKIFREQGKRIEVKAGEYVISDDMRDAAVSLVEKGVVEAVIATASSISKDQAPNLHTHREFHPCGTPIPDSNSGLSERVPVSTVLGRGSVVGFSCLVHATHFLMFRAQTDVTLYQLQRKEGMPSEKKSGSLSSMRSKTMLTADESDEDFEAPEEIDGVDEVLADKNQHLVARPLSDEATQHRASFKNIFKSSGEATQHRASFKNIFNSDLPNNSSSRPLCSDPESRFKAWLVLKRLNVLQTWWRIMVFDDKNGCLINKALKRLDSVTNIGEVPQVSSSEMMHGQAQVRKMLAFKDIRQIVQFSDDSPKVMLKFNSDQRPYHIEFLDLLQRNDFIATMRKVMPSESFVLRRLPTVAKSGMRAADYNISGVNEQSMPQMFQGICFKLAQQLDRTRTECIRISRLRALSDTESLKMMYDEGEQLRQDCVKKFNLPVSEKMVLTSKCFVESVDMRIGRTRVRLILLTDTLVLDKDIFGPQVNQKSFIFRLDQMYQVHDEHQNEGIEGDWSFCVNVLQERNNGQEIFEFRITCSQASIMHEVREGLEGMCAKARDIRQKEQQRQGAESCLSTMGRRFGIVHRLKNRQELVEARTVDSLFLVEIGAVTIFCENQVFKKERPGRCFGETNFVKGEKSSQFTVMGDSNDCVVIELPRKLVLKSCQQDLSLASSFWFTLCNVLDSQLLELMNLTFPGDWSAAARSKEQASKRTDSPEQKVDRSQSMRPQRSKTTTPRLQKRNSVAF